MRRGSPEHDLQASCIAQYDILNDHGRYAHLPPIYAIPNGGDRHPAVAMKLKAEGVRRGVPDLFLPYPAHGLHGLYLEAKAGTKLSNSQVKWCERSTANGYGVAVFTTPEQFFEAIDAYLNGCLDLNAWEKWKKKPRKRSSNRG